MLSYRFIILCAVTCASGSLFFASAGRADTLPDASTDVQAGSGRNGKITVADAPGPVSLRMCREIALANQPAIAAARATLAAAVDRANALENLHGLASLSRELPVRKRQAALGITIARGGLAQAEAETLYGVTFSYLGAIYANQQMDLAGQIRSNLDDLQKLIDDALQSATGKKSRTVVLNEHRNAVNAYVATLQGRLEEAQQGEQRAQAALREAMGAGCDYPLPPLPRMLPCPKIAVTKEELIALALARRGEIVQTSNAVEVVCLEIEAQGLTCRSLTRTFAAGSDIHARAVPFGIYDGRTYRPGAVAPEMPTTLVGSRGDRQTQARDYLHRAQAVDAKTRQLIALNVQDAYLRWREKSASAEKLEKAYQEHWQFSSKLRSDIKYPIDMEKQRQPVPPYPNMDDLLHANVLTTRLLLEWKDAQYQALLALAALEQATGGGFAVDFDTAPACPPVTPSIRAQ
jgi:outer membrane protein TolC